MGHIALASSVVHVWFFKGAPSILSLILDVPPRAIEQVIYFARYLVLEIEEKKKKDSIEAVDKARIERQKELKETYDARIEELKSKSDQEKVKAEKKIKNKEQLSLAVSEIELEERKKETTLLEEKKTTTLRTDELFEGLISLIK